MRVEVKWLDGQWKSFGTSKPLASAGVAEIIELVSEDMDPHCKPGEVVNIRVHNDKFIFETGPKHTKKLSKSDQD